MNSVLILLFMIIIVINDSLCVACVSDVNLRSLLENANVLISKNCSILPPFPLLLDAALFWLSRSYSSHVRP